MRKTISVSLKEEMINAIDKERGLIPRSALVERYIEAGLARRVEHKEAE
jgi:metal-responsive CopG/Arc/MetJ family transcriptional regulator